MKIKYVVHKGWCITCCPNKKDAILKVGNRYCHNCFYFIHDDEKKHIVECFFKKK